MQSPEFNARLTDRLLQVIEDEIIPLTSKQVERGNKIFGAAIIEKGTLDLVVAGSNGEIDNPLWHGEIDCLNRYWAMAAHDRPSPSQCLFLSTHEPCPLCLSAITWSGFDNFHYFFSYQDSRDAFAIPHDLKILEEVFGCKDGAYRKKNHYWSSHSLMSLMESGDDQERHRWGEAVQRIHDAYDRLSDRYQSTKGQQEIPLP